MKHVISIVSMLLWSGLAGCDTPGGPQGADMAAPGADLASTPDLRDPGGELGGSPDLAQSGQGDMAGSEAPPALNGAAILAWLQGGAYKSWRCEPTVDMDRSAAHGKTRICSNRLQATAAGAPYPVGAATVKEIYDGAGTNLTGYAFAIRTAPGEGGANRYWYERIGTTVFADSAGAAVCVNCHVGATLDYTFITVK